MSDPNISSEPSRETISLLLISILGGVGLIEATLLLQDTITKAHGIPGLSIVFFFVYLSIWMRFVPGNLSYIRRLERWPKATVYTWLLDVSVITVESLFLVYMARPSINDVMQFYASVLLLLFLDIGWLAVQVTHKKGKRPPANDIWLKLNIPSAFLIATSLLLGVYAPDYAQYVGPTGIFGTYIIPVLLYAFAAIDIYYSAPDWYGQPRVAEPEGDELEKHKKWMDKAIAEAIESEKEGGIPIGAVLVQDDTLVSSGHNLRIQDKNPLAHAEIVCISKAGLREKYSDMTLYSTLIPCALCVGAIFHIGVRRVVVGDSRNFLGARSCLWAWGIKVVDLRSDKCYNMLKSYIDKNPNVWNADIGITKQ
jgi:creatinine deaminase